MDTLREIFLSIGKGNYSIRTPLQDEALERVEALIRQAGPHPGDCVHMPFRGMDQETLLVLTCLQLAYTLDTVTTRLEALSEKLERTQQEEDPGLSPEEQ